MKKFIITFFIVIGFSLSVNAAEEKSTRENVYKNRISGSRVTAPPKNSGNCSMAIVLAYQNGNIEEEDLPAECGGIADFNESGNGGTEIYGDANSGYMRDGEYVQEWGVLNNFNSKWAQLQYGPYDEIYTVDIVNTNRRRAGAVSSIRPSAILFNCQSFYDRDGEMSDCRIKWKITARKSSEDTSTSDFISGTQTYYISFNLPGTSRQCVASSQVAGRPTHGSCTTMMNHPLGYAPTMVFGYYVDVATSVSQSFRASFEKYNFSGNLKTPGRLISGSDTGATCSNWKNGDFSGCSVSTSAPNPCSPGEAYINGSCIDPRNLGI